MTDLLIGIIVVVILGCAIGYIVKEKKAGTKCIGCPDSGVCSSQGKSACCSCSCGCGGESETK